MAGRVGPGISVILMEIFPLTVKKFQIDVHPNFPFQYLPAAMCVHWTSLDPPLALGLWVLIAKQLLEPGL